MKSDDVQRRWIQIYDGMTTVSDILRTWLRVVWEEPNVLRPALDMLTLCK